MNQNHRRKLCACVPGLLLCALAACSTPASIAPAATARPAPASPALQASLRVIVYFHSPVTDSPAVSAVIGQACHCQPVFVRQYSENVLIYAISLPPGAGFASFQSTLMKNAAQSGVQLVEEDRRMQHQ